MSMIDISTRYMHLLRHASLADMYLSRVDISGRHLYISGRSAVPPPPSIHPDVSLALIAIPKTRGKRGIPKAEAAAYKSVTIERR
jgi:hypothetical protein